MKEVWVGCFLFIVTTAYGIRDIFDFYAKIEQPLVTMNPRDLEFLGSIIQLSKRFGFVQDPLGNVYCIRLGDAIGGPNNKVVKVLEDQILLAADNNYMVIK